MVREGNAMEKSDVLTFAGRRFRSRLIVGTGKYPDYLSMQRAHDASGAEIVTVAVRRVNLDRTQESLLDYIDTKRYTLLPNTAGCYTAEEAIKTAILAREVGLSDLVKLEVIGDQRTLFPDNEELLKATRVLVKEGFVVLPYTNDDPVMAKKLEDAGAAAVMPSAPRSARASGYEIRTISRSSSRRRESRSLSMREWARRQMPLSPWSWGATAS